MNEDKNSSLNGDLRDGKPDTETPQAFYERIIQRPEVRQLLMRLVDASIEEHRKSLEGLAGGRDDMDPRATDR